MLRLRSSPYTPNEVITMPVIVACLSCQGRIKIPSKVVHSGRSINCPRCNAPLQFSGRVAPAQAAEKTNAELLRAASPAPPTPMPACPTQVVQCPHCATQVIDDGWPSGQAVSCPCCSGGFHMPSPATVGTEPT